MPKTRISEYSVTNSSNTDIEGINIDEGCAPSGINNAIRELMVHLKEFQTGASGDAFTFAGGVLISGTANTITGNVLMSGTNTITGSTTATFAAGAVGTPSIAAHGDTNTGIFFPAADTIAFAEGGAEAMRIDSSGNVGIGVTPSAWGSLYKAIEGGDSNNQSSFSFRTDANIAALGANFYYDGSTNVYKHTGTAGLYQVSGNEFIWYNAPSGTGGTGATFTERMRIDSSGNVGIGTSSPVSKLHVKVATDENIRFSGGSGDTRIAALNDAADTTTQLSIQASPLLFRGTGGTERARITSGGVFCVGSNDPNFGDGVAKFWAYGTSSASSFAAQSTNAVIGYFNRHSDDGTLLEFRQANAAEGSISVSGATVSYNAFAGSHWSQLQQGRGYNPEIPRGTVMSTIGEMCEWKSVVWDEVIEHPAVPAVEAKEAVLDEECNVIEPAVDAVEGKDAWTETIPHREAYLGNLAVGATFEEDGVTKTVVDDGNERLPKVKISDVVGDKAVYGVFQTYDEVQDMLVTSLGAFVVRIAAGVTVQIGDLLESNGDGCAKVQDDDVIRSKTIGKVTSTTPSATYADGSYTVPAVLYCG